MRKINVKIPKARNPHVAALHTGMFKTKVVPLKKHYNRKKQTKAKYLVD